MIISAIQFILNPIFGKFEREEFKKFLRMGITFTFILGAYWTIRTLKATVFITLVGADYQPIAKTFSILLLVPLVMLYTKILDYYSREKVFYGLSFLYGIATLLFAVLLNTKSFGMAESSVIAARTGIEFWGTQILGYLWYVFVESYGSLIIALFWAIASDTTMPDSAKRGFSLVVALGQVGAIIGPKYINKLPDFFIHRLPHMPLLHNPSVAVAVASLMIFCSILFLKYFLTSTPKHLLTSFKGTNEKKVEKEQEPGVLEGLWLLLEHKYLLGIFAVNFFFEFIVTVFDFHFQKLAALTYTNQNALGVFMGDYGSAVNAVALICLLCGVSNITRYLGITVSLCLTPLIIGGAVFGFTSFDSIHFLFWLMAGSKAINYALNGPALKQLYIPTSHDTRFKAQAWIETFGSRASKEGGAIFNMILKPLQTKFGPIVGRLYHVTLSSYVGYSFVIVWFFVALFLGRTFKKAIDEKRVVC